MGRVLGLDVGERRIGVALSDPLGLTAQRLTVVGRHGLARDVDAVAAVANEHEVDAVIVGLPLTLQGHRGEQANRVLAFVEALRGKLRCPVRLWDERLTTVQGERALLETGATRRQRRRLIDQIAAQLILQAYLDARSNP